MTQTLNRYAYSAFGLVIASEIRLPELMPILADPSSAVADIVVDVADLERTWSELAGDRKNVVVKDGVVLFRVPNSASYRIQGGDRITVSPLPEADEDEIRLYVLGTCMGALLLQRRVLPLHGSAIAIGGRAYAIVGESGAGKSTLASAFVDSGYQLLTDDVIAVDLKGEAAVPYVIPAYPQQKLWQDSLELFGMETNRYRPLFLRETKYAIPRPDRFATEPLPLSGIFELVKTTEEGVSISRFESLHRLALLSRHTFRGFLVDALGRRDWHFTTCASIANRISSYRLLRPDFGFTARALAELILTTIDQERSS